MLSQLADPDPKIFEVVIVIAFILGLLALGLTVAKNGAAEVVKVLAVCAFILSFVWLT